MASAGVVAADSIIVGLRGSDDNVTFTTRLFAIDEFASFTTLANSGIYTIVIRTDRNVPLPKYWKLMINNKSGAAFDSTGGNFSAQYVGVLEGNDQLATAATANSATAAANTAVVITYAADAVNQHTMHGLVVSYAGAAPTGGSVKVENGSGNIVFQADLTAQGPIWLPAPLIGTVNTAMIVTLAAAGASCVGKVNVLGKGLL
jgi:hypothetical protein